MTHQPPGLRRRSSLSVAAIVLAVIVGVLGRATLAHAGVFTDANARVFTLTPYADGEVGRLHGTGDDFTVWQTPFARASLAVDAQGEIKTRFVSLEPAPVGPQLTHTIAPQRLGAAVRTHVVSSLAAVATVKALIRRADDRGSVALAPARTLLAAGAAWNVTLPLTARQLRTGRRWLARGREVIARVEVTLESDVGVGPATVVQSRGVPLTRRERRGTHSREGRQGARIFTNARMPRPVRLRQDRAHRGRASRSLRVATPRVVTRRPSPP